MRLLRTALLLLALPSFTACGGGDDDGPDASQQAAPSQDTMSSMEGMPGMEAGDAGMMGRMNTHMTMMRGLSTDSTMAMLATHRQLVANMIAQMNREMRDMGMASDAAWDASVDSLRSDLTRMPEMSGPELQAMMPDHDRRVLRLMEMHRRMMGGMAR